MITVLLGLTAAVFFGTSDFLGGLASRVTTPLKVTAISACTGLIILSVAATLSGGHWSAQAALLGALGGVSAALAISLLYACLAIGPMSLLSPLAGLVSSSLPMVAGLLQGERLGITGNLGIAFALGAVALVGFTRQRKRTVPIRLRGVAMALGAGTMFGIFLILMDRTPHDSGLIPLAMSRAVTATVMISALLVTGRIASRRGIPPKLPSHDRTTAPRALRYLFELPSAPAWKRGVRIAIACGILDSTGNSLQLLGLRVGDLSVMSVLNGLYPTVIVILASVVLKERVTRLQLAGLLSALTAAALFSIS